MQKMKPLITQRLRRRSASPARGTTLIRCFVLCGVDLLPIQFAVAGHLVVAEIATGEIVLLLNAEPVLNILDAGYIFNDIFGHSLVTAAVHKAAESDLAVLDFNVDIGCVKVAVVSQTIIDVFFDAIVGSSVVFRPATTMSA
jgi:hypothetical protein